MFQRPSSPRSIGGNLDDAIRLYAASWRAWLWPGVLAGALAGVMQFVTDVSATTAARGNPFAAFAWVSNPVAVIVYLLAAFAGIWVYCAIIVGLDDVYNGREASASASFSRGLRLVPRIFLAGLLYGLGFIVACMLLIIPGLIVAGRWLLYGPALVVERLGATDSLRRSWKLVQSHWWRTVTVITVAGIIIIVLALSVPLLAGVVLGIMHRPSALFTIIVVLTIFERVVTAAALPAVLLVVYYDLRLRKEGGDLSSRVDALTAG